MGTWARTESAGEAREREAFDAAFRELGLPCTIDDATFEALGALACDEERVLRCLEAHAPHLLKAYEPQFLVAAICNAKSGAVEDSSIASRGASGRFEYVAGQTGF